MEMAMTSASFVPHFEQRMRRLTVSRVAAAPHRRASVSGSAIRLAPGKVPTAARK
jgi:hypothetical protein